VTITANWKTSADFICETCVHYPPSSFGGKPCLECNPDDLFQVGCYQPREKPEPEPPQTNRDWLRTLSNEKLAEVFAQQMVGLVCRVASDLGYDLETEKQFLLEQNKMDWLDWLKSPAGGDGDA